MPRTDRLLRKYLKEEGKNKDRLITITYSMFLAMVLMAGLIGYQFAEFRDMKHTLQLLVSQQKDADILSNGTVGYYDGSIQLIRVLGKDRDPFDVYQTCTHELAHYIDYEHLKLFKSKKYNETFSQTDDFVSEYAKTNVKEYFAETFMTAMYGCINMSKVPQDQRKYFKAGVLKYFPECG